MFSMENNCVLHGNLLIAHLGHLIASLFLCYAWETPIRRKEKALQRAKFETINKYVDEDIAISKGAPVFLYSLYMSLIISFVITREGKVNYGILYRCSVKSRTYELGSLVRTTPSQMRLC